MRCLIKPFVLLIFLGFSCCAVSVSQQQGTDIKFSFQKLLSDDISCLYTGDGFLAAGTDKGLSVYNYHTGKWHLFHKKGESPDVRQSSQSAPLADSRITGIASSGKRIWVTTSRGLACYNLLSYTWEKGFSVLDEMQLSCITREHARLWIGTWGYGIQCFDMYGKRLNDIHRDESLYGSFNARYITAVQYDPYRKCIWAASEDAGIGCYKNGIWTVINNKTPDSPFITNEIIALCITPHYVWAGTNSGLFAYNLKEWRSILRHVNNLPSNKITALSANSEKIYAGTESGIAVISGFSVKIIEQTLNREPFPVENTAITAITWDKKHIWAGTRSGLYRIRISDEI